MDFFEKLLQLVDKEDLQTDISLMEYTTFRTGGPAKYFVTPKSNEQVCGVINLCTIEKMPYFVLGRGSNLLVSDQGFFGVVIATTKYLSDYEITNNRLHAQAGASVMTVAKACANVGLKGLSFAAGIPGSIAGAVKMNAGAYGAEIKDTLTGVSVYDPKMNEIVYLESDKLDLSYRHSIFHEKPYIILSADFLLDFGTDSEETRTEELLKIEEYAKLRREKQPLNYPSAGSTFKRPEGYFAGKLIEDAGLKGLQVGGAMVSTKHCGFIVNTDHATSKDIYELSQKVIETVKMKFNVTLELEMILLGEF